LSPQLYGKHGKQGPDLPRHKARPYLKITKAKRAGGMTQVVEYLPSKCEALISTSITAERGGRILEFTSTLTEMKKIYLRGLERRFELVEEYL
jgi:hypothetical protein